MKNVLLGAGCLLAALTATALPGEIAPGIDAAHSLAYTVDNDAAGLAPVAEWDDLRTFGMNLAVGLHPSLALHADYQSLTWRSDSPGTASRIDSLSLCLSGILARQSAAGFRLAARGSVGASLFGNLGGMALQGGYHQRVGIERPFPDTYDQYSSAALALSLSTEASLQRWLARPALFVSAEGNVPGSWQVQGGARVSLGSAGHSADAWALYRHQTLAGLSPTLDRVSALSRGAVAGFEIAASVLTCAAELNMVHGRFPQRRGNPPRVGRRPLPTRSPSPWSCTSIPRWRIRAAGSWCRWRGPAFASSRTHSSGGRACRDLRQQAFGRQSTVRASRAGSACRWVGWRESSRSAWRRSPRLSRSSHCAWRGHACRTGA